MADSPGHSTVTHAVGMSDTSVGSQPAVSVAADTVASIGATASLVEVAQGLASADVGLLAVIEDQDVRGVVSERDVVRALGAGRDLATTTVSEIIGEHVIWCDVESTIAQVAAEMMEQYVRHVLIEDNGRLVGIVSARDLLGSYAAADLPF